MLRWVLATAARLRELDLSGFVLQKGSPSCGLERVQARDAAAEHPSPTGRGCSRPRSSGRCPGSLSRRRGD
jgi:uncharacterized protein YbbK (DUF523 family)